MNDSETIGKVRVVTVLGATMLVTGIYYLILRLMDFSDEFDEILAVGSYVVITAVGLWILIHKEMRMREGVYLCGLAIGTAIVMQNLMFMILDLDDMTFFLELGSLVLGAMLILFAAGFLFGYQISSKRLLITVAIEILIIIMPMFLDWYVKVVPALTIIKENYVQFPLLILFLVYGFVLTRDGIRNLSVKERIERNLDSIEGMFHSDADMYMTPEDADRVMDPGAWTRMEGGPVESEVSVVLHGEHSVTLLFQRMRGDGVIHAIVLNNGPDSFIQGFRFDISESIRNDGSITFYGPRGVFTRVRVSEVPAKGRRIPLFRKAEPEA